MDFASIITAAGYTDPIVIVKPDVLRKLERLVLKYTQLLFRIKIKTELSEGTFSDLKFFLSHYCNLESIRQCTSLHDVLQLLIEHSKINAFNIDTLNAIGEYLDHVIIHSVQEYKEDLDKFFSSTTVKEFIDTLQTRMESFTLRTDQIVSDYILRALRELIHHVTGVGVIAEQVFKVVGEKAHSLQWAEQGFSMHIPEHGLLPNETCAVVVKAIVGGDFQFPADTEPVSAIYSIFISKPLQRPARIQLQHCAMLTDPECLTFAVASHGSSTPYIFYEVPQGNFDSFFGWIDRQQFSFVTTLRRKLRKRRVERSNPIRYSALTFTERKEFGYHWILAVSKNLRTLKQNVIDHFKNVMEEEDVEFVFNEEELLTVKVTDAPDVGWIIEPLAKPCIIKKKEVDSRDRVCDRVCGPKCVRVRVATEYGNPPKTALRTTIQLDGVSPQRSFNILFNPPPPPRVPHHQGEPPLLLGSAPTPSQFYTMVIKKIPSRWHTFGIMLDIEPAILDGFNKPNSEKCFTEVYKTWKANAKRPFTWRTVLTVLNDIDENTLKHQIELHLS